jgi:hypothetical protein
MAADFISRMAGKALMDFFKVAATKTADVARAQTLSAIQGMQNPTGLFAVMAAHPETTANIVGAAAPLAATGGITAAGYLGKKALNAMSSGQNVGDQRVSFANQQYIPGSSPMTNQAMAQSMLMDQRMQYQLQLLQARQNASQPDFPSIQQTGNPGNLINAMSKTYTY